METAKLVLSIVAIVLSAGSLGVALVADRRSRNAEAIKNLLGEKETVAFAALKLLRDGLPKSRRQRKLVIAAVMQACIFENSDRARALLYRVIEANGDSGGEFQEAISAIEQSFESMARYNFSQAELDLKNYEKYKGALRKVVPRSA